MKNEFIKIISTYLLLLLILTPLESLAKSIPVQLDELFNESLEAGNFNGNVLIFLKGNMIYHKSFGIANFNPEEVLTSNSQFALASMSKQFTAIAIMMLNEKGQLSYDDDISKYLPEIPYEDITIRHLLTHTSGLPSSDDLYNAYIGLYDTSNMENGRLPNNDDLLERLVKESPARVNPPGKMYSYSNTGYQLLALIVSRVSNQPFNLFLKNNIFNPLSMSSTLIFDGNNDDSIKHRVYGLQAYRDDKNELKHTYNDFHYMQGMYGSGSMYSTTIDLFKWDRALYTDKLVLQSTLKEAFEPLHLNDGSTYNYGFGWYIDRSDRGTLYVSHGGNLVGFRTYIMRGVEDDTTIILLNNITKSHKKLFQKLLKIIDLH